MNTLNVRIDQEKERFEIKKEILQILEKKI